MMNDTMAPEDESLPQDASADSSGDDSEGGNTFFVPASVFAGKEAKAGDTVSFTVVGKDSEGDYEVELAGGNKEDGDFMGDMKKMFSKGGSNG